MGLENVGQEPVKLWDAGWGRPGLIVNTSITGVLYTGPAKAISAWSDQIPPLGSLAVDGQGDVYASALSGGMVQALAILGGTAWTASPAEIATQIALSQAPGANMMGAGPYAPGFVPGTQVIPVAFPAVHVRVAPSAGYGTVTLSWFADAAGDVLLGSDAWAVGSSWGLSVIMPAKGDFFQVTLDVTSVAPLTGSFYAAGVFLAATFVTYLVTGEFLLEAPTLPASATAVYPLQWITRGETMLSITPGDTAAKIHYQVVTLAPSGSIAGIIYDAGTPAAPTGPLMLIIPDAPVALSVVNTDAGASHAFTASLVPAGRL